MLLTGLSSSPGSEGVQVQVCGQGSSQRQSRAPRRVRCGAYSVPHGKATLLGRGSLFWMRADVDISLALKPPARSACRVSCGFRIGDQHRNSKRHRVCRVTSSGMHPAAVGVVRFILAWPWRPGSVGSEPGRGERGRGQGVGVGPLLTWLISWVKREITTCSCGAKFLRLVGCT